MSGSSIEKNQEYAVVRAGGLQHRVAAGDSLLVDRMPQAEGAKVALEPLLYRGDQTVIDADGLKQVSVEAIVRGHERGPKIRVFKFKPKRGYKRTTGHRSELTRLEISKIAFSGGAAKGKAAASPKASAPAKSEAGPKASAPVKSEAGPKIDDSAGKSSAAKPAKKAEKGGDDGS